MNNNLKEALIILIVIPVIVIIFAAIIKTHTGGALFVGVALTAFIILLDQKK